MWSFIKDAPRSINCVHALVDISMMGLAIDKRLSLIAICSRAGKFFSTFFECDMTCLFMYFPARSGHAPGGWVVRKDGSERNGYYSC